MVGGEWKRKDKIKRGKEKKIGRGNKEKKRKKK